MKTKVLIISTIILLSFSQLNAQTGQEYDNEDGTSMLPITYNLVDVVKEIEKNDVEIVRVEFDLLFTTKESFRTLHSDYTYGILAYGDYRIQEIGIRLYKKDASGNWRYEIDGEISTNTCKVFVKPEETAEYKIELRAIKFTEGFSGGHYGFIVIHD